MSRFPILVFLLTCAVPALGGTFTTHEALEYATPGRHSLLLDLRVPDGPGAGLLDCDDQRVPRLELRGPAVGKRRSVGR